MDKRILVAIAVIFVIIVLILFIKTPSANKKEYTVTIEVDRKSEIAKLVKEYGL